MRIFEYPLSSPLTLTSFQKKHRMFGEVSRARITGNDKSYNTIVFKRCFVRTRRTTRDVLLIITNWNSTWNANTHFVFDISRGIDFTFVLHYTLYTYMDCISNSEMSVEIVGLVRRLKALKQWLVYCSCLPELCPFLLCWVTTRNSFKTETWVHYYHVNYYARYSSITRHPSEKTIFFFLFLSNQISSMIIIRARIVAPFVVL